MPFAIKYILIIRIRVSGIFLQHVFCLDPAIKKESEKIEQRRGKFIYKRDFLKYIKINCILLPPKKNIYNINEYKIKVIKEL